MDYGRLDLENFMDVATSPMNCSKFSKTVVTHSTVCKFVIRNLWEQQSTSLLKCYSEGRI